MKRIHYTLMALTLSIVFFACQKPVENLAPATTNTGGSGGSGGTGGTGGGTGGTGGGGSTTEGFSAKFTIEVPDINNVFEKNEVKLVSRATGVVSYVWQLGDGRKVYDSNPVITYNLHGIYNIRLTVTDANGRTDTSTKELNILCNFLGH